jgi:F-type H+-transporting ATPase subunit epsilon
MADDIMLEVVTPDRKVLSEKVSLVVAPGAEGEFGVLPGHVTFMTLLGTGILSYKSMEGTHALVVSEGFAEVAQDKVTVLAEHADVAGEIDFEQARQSLTKLEEQLKGRGPHDEDFHRMRAEVERNGAKIALAGKR